jgi:hypothetical protein
MSFGDNFLLEGGRDFYGTIFISESSLANKSGQSEETGEDRTRRFLLILYT